MTARRTLFAAAPALVASLASANSALAQAAHKPAKEADFLFVQTAKGVMFDKSTSKLTLDGVSSDIIGMPLTPFSLAGVARRSYLRAFFR